MVSAGYRPSDSYLPELDRLVQDALSQNLRLLRKQRNATNTVFKYALGGRGESHISARMGGKSRWQVHEVYALAEAFQVPLSSLFPPRRIASGLVIPVPET